MHYSGMEGEMRHERQTDFRKEPVPIGVAHCLGGSFPAPPPNFSLKSVRIPAEKLLAGRKNSSPIQHPPPIGTGSKNLDGKTFRDFYYLKEELTDFCRKNGLPVSGGKMELTDRIACFLDTGEVPAASAVRKRAPAVIELHEDTIIEAEFVCSERHRAFFKEHIGSGFSFHAAFQKWLKSNAGKTYKEAIAAYFQLLAEKKKGRAEIERQFAYNTYIRDFFADNPGKSLEEAIRCWKYKKQLQGHPRYERSDLAAHE